MQKLLFKILEAGEIPEHIAIIMDGNRRYARKHHLSSVSEGHKMGAQKLKELIEWLGNINGVKQLSVYAFSILNFKRTAEEVSSLMDLAESTFRELADNHEDFEKRKCAVRFIGRIEMLEERVRAQIDRLVSYSPPDPEFILNICACYTSHDEIEHARDKCIAQHIDLSWDNVFANLELPSKPDLLIRTSGVLRMSNYMLMQCAETPIVVCSALWPELTLFDFFCILLRFQCRNLLL